MDPDFKKAQQALFSLKAAFKKAADADTGSAKQLFQKLSNDFSDTIDEGMRAANNNMSPQALKEHMKETAGKMQQSFIRAVMAAQTNPKAMQTLVELQKDVVNVMKSLTGGNPPPSPGKKPGRGFRL